MVELEAERLYDTNGAAAAVRMHVETFRRLVRQGKAPESDLQPTPRKRFWRGRTLMEWARPKTKNVPVEPT